MDFKKYIIEQTAVDLGYIARKMWPDNKSAKTYLSRKLNGTDGRTWTQKDNELAKRVLNELGIELAKL